MIRRYAKVKIAVLSYPSYRLLRAARPSKIIEVIMRAFDVHVHPSTRGLDLHACGYFPESQRHSADAAKASPSFMPSTMFKRS